MHVFFNKKAKFIAPILPVLYLKAKLIQFL